MTISFNLVLFYLVLFYWAFCHGKGKIARKLPEGLAFDLGSQHKQLGIAHGDIKDLVQALFHIVGDHGPDYPAVGDDQYWLGQICFKGVEERGASGIKIMETFAPRWCEPGQVRTSLGKIQGVVLLNPFKRSVVPVSHVDLIDPFINYYRLSRTDEFCGAAAAVQAGAEDLAEWDRCQGFGPGSGLVQPFCIQRQICLADEPFFPVCFNLPVAEQENQGTGAGIPEKWGCR